MVEKANGKLKLVALAAELPLASKAIKYLTDQGVRVSLAHTNCMYDEAKKAFKEGITVTTHTANVMTGIHHRNMGTLGAALLDDDVYNEVICDGKHVSVGGLSLSIGNSVASFGLSFSNGHYAYSYIKDRLNWGFLG